jgi:hypothetical protein
MGMNGDLDIVRNACALHTRPVFALRLLAENAGVPTHAIEGFIVGKSEAELPPETISKLVRVIFHNRADWDPQSKSLVDVVKPATLSNAL